MLLQLEEGELFLSCYPLDSPRRLGTADSLLADPVVRSKMKVAGAGRRLALRVVAALAGSLVVGTGPGFGCCVADLWAPFVGIGCSVSDLKAAVAAVGSSVYVLKAAFVAVGSSVSDLKAAFAAVGCTVSDLKAAFAAV